MNIIYRSTLAIVLLCSACADGLAKLETTLSPAAAVLAIQQAYKARDVGRLIDEGEQTRGVGPSGAMDVFLRDVDAVLEAVPSPDRPAAEASAIVCVIEATRWGSTPARFELLETYVNARPKAYQPMLLAGMMEFVQSVAPVPDAELDAGSLLDVRLIGTLLIMETPVEERADLEAWFLRVYHLSSSRVASAIYSEDGNGVIRFPDARAWARESHWVNAQAVRALEARTTDDLSRLREELRDLRREMIIRIIALDQSIDSRIRSQVTAATKSLQREIDAVGAELKVLRSRVDRNELILEVVVREAIPGAGRSIPEATDGFVDEDVDKIDDQLERHLIDAFAPLIVLDRPIEHGTADRVGVPCDPYWFATESNVVLRPERKGDLDPDLYRLNPREAMQLTDRFESVRGRFRGLGEDFRTQRPVKPSLLYDIPRADHDLISLTLESQPELWWQGNSGGWDAAADAGDGLFARVWRPFTDHQHLLSVQYFVFLTWNESATYKNPAVEDQRAGSHEGDWLCIDLCINVAKPHVPHLVHAIYHNHGRQIFILPESLEYHRTAAGDVHPLVYLEWGSNEPWPNAGHGGEEGWPRRDGIGLNERFLVNAGVGPIQKKISDEDQVVSSHAGQGIAWPTWQHAIPNLGEFSKGLPVPLEWAEESERNAHRSREIVLRFGGHWGHRRIDLETIGSLFMLRETDNPPGPTKGKFWKRRWGDRGGPWQGGSNPNDIEGWKLHTRNGYRFSH